jgi:hypothetical protein
MAGDDTPARYRDIFDKKAVAHLATVGPDGQVALAVQDPDNPRGRDDRGGADAHIDALARKSVGQDRYPLAAAGRGAAPGADPARARAGHGTTVRRG